jgi:hypothetical protein
LAKIEKKFLSDFFTRKSKKEEKNCADDIAKLIMLKIIAQTSPLKQFLALADLGITVLRPR